jgi:peptidoglycan/LPS O-acetylase OafA/YrhL
MRKLGYRPELDGVRGIAIALVVAMHAGNFTPGLDRGWLRGGALGVDLFFVLSGFLITSLLLSEWDRSATVSLRDFYRRRARRLLPALLAFVGLAALAAIAVAPSRALDVLVLTVVRASYAANFFVAFSPAGVGFGFAHLWSLAQEEQFYFLWPPLLLFLLRRRARPRHLLLVLGAAILAVNVQRWLLVSGGAGWARLWYAPDTHCDAIVFGCAAAVIWTHQMVRIPKAVAVAAAVVVVPIVAGFRAYDTGLYPIALPLFAAASSILLVTLLDHRDTAVARLVAARPLRAAGKISYGLYLWHFTMLDFFGLIGLPLGIAACIVSYRYVEQPFLRRRSPVRAGSVPPVPLTQEPARRDGQRILDACDRSRAERAPRVPSRWAISPYLQARSNPAPPT